MLSILRQSPTQTINHYWHRWVDRRSSPQSRHQLHHKNLFILPTVTGWAFVLLAFIIWLLGTNYQNNLILALSYFQMSLLIIVILHTYNNLAGLTIECLGSNGGHSGEAIDFQFRVTSANGFGCHNVMLAWAEGPRTIYDIEGGEPQTITVSVKGALRGRFKPGRLLVRSVFPMGLIKCWTWLRFDEEIIVYPQVLECPFPSVATAEGGESENSEKSIDGEEFLGYRQYRPGDSLRHIAWKQYARERGLYSKVFGGSNRKSECLGWRQFYRGDTEEALSQMTYWALSLHKQGHGFALSLPASELPFGDDEAHLAEALKSLALYGERH